jgi:metal-responsive CopG/Arc/MetJ family transcriptional regulator
MRRQITVDLDEATARELERIAPSRARKRSEFVRRALRHALDAEAERRMAHAYRQRPDDVKPELIDLESWEPRSSAPSASRSTGRS